jgi:hypothetical protein
MFEFILLIKVKTIYIHSKMTIVDDKFVSIGSSNMDSLSFFKSSEINLNVYSSSIAIETKERIVREHLEYFNKQMSTNFKYIFQAFERVAKENHESLLKSGKLVGRIVHLVPHEKLEFISNLVNYPSPFMKVLYKFGLNNTMLAENIIRNMQDSTDPNVNSFFLQSML